jgi:hypothetical protein
MEKYDPFKVFVNDALGKVFYPELPRQKKSQTK